MTFYAYNFPFDCHILGSDGTVSIWDKDARTRMKSKHPFPLHWSPLPHHVPRLVSARVLVRSSLVTRHPVPLSISRLTTQPPPTYTYIHIQHLLPCRALSLARPSITRERRSLMRLRTTGRRDTRGTCLRTGTRCCCMGVRRTRLESDHRSLGWARSDYPVDRSFAFPLVLLS